jgi:WD40 repeat protein
MILLATRPGDAKVYVDGKRYKSNSPLIYLLPLRINRLNLGEHAVKVEKDGYETWEGTFNVDPGVVAWANYILLVPQKREAQEYNLAGDVAQTVQSEDKTRLLSAAYNKTSKIYSIWEVDTGNKQIKRLFETKVADGETYAITGYSNSKNRVLIEKTNNKVKTHFIIEATENGKNWTIDNLFNLQFDTYCFNPKNENELYALKDKNLYSIDYSGKKLSAILAEKVQKVYPDEGSLYFVQNVDGNYGLWRLEQNNTKTNIVKNLPVSDNYQIDYLSDIDSYAILALKGKEFYLFTVEGGTPVLKEISKDVDSFLASPRSKFIGLVRGDNVVSYEPGRNVFHTVLTKRTITSLAWLPDEYNLIYSEGAKAHIINYNGYYDKFLFDTADKSPIFSAAADNNYYFLNLNKVKNTLDLFSSSL